MIYQLSPPRTTIGLIQAFGLTNGLKLCLDVGDRNSYDSIQTDKWLDRSGNGYDFFRGSGTGIDAADPTFNGSPGGLSSSEYWSFDGGDWFTYDSVNETWMENCHKAGAKFSYLCALYYVAGTAQALAGDRIGGAGTTGFSLAVNGTNQLVITVQNSAANVLSFTSTTTFPAGWNLLGMKIDEAAGANGSFAFINGTVEQFNGAYTSPSAGASSATMQIGARGSGAAPLSNTARMASFAMWETTTLTDQQMAMLAAQLRKRLMI